MWLFRPAPIPVVGVDISSTAVKMLELAQVGKGNKNYRVESYAVEPLAPKIVEDKMIKDVEAVADAVKRALKRTKVKANHAAVAVAGSSVINKIIQMPAGLSDNEMEAEVQMQAETHISFPIDEVYFDFELIGPSEKNPTEESDVLLAASKRDIIDDRVAAMELAGLKVKVVDLELFALENAFALLAQNDPEIDPKDVIALIDIGASNMTFTILNDLKIVYIREQNFGGNQLTEHIQQRYGLSFEEAALAKRHGGLPEDYESEVLEPFKDEVAQEISRMVQFYYSAATTGNIAHTVIAGGCAAIPGIVEHIADKIGGHVTVANPFANMSVSAKVNKKALMNDAPSLMIACGLAIRSFDPPM
ncbi:MAG: type pilus assembly protein PilM [Pseudomonadota bacterium]|jgi:type IV pilus assembly protein PilM